MLTLLILGCLPNQLSLSIYIYIIMTYSINSHIFLYFLDANSKMLIREKKRKEIEIEEKLC